MRRGTAVGFPAPYAEQTWEQTRMIKRLPLATRPLTIAAALIACFVWPTTVVAGMAYVVTDLGTLGGTESVAAGINDAGEVVGTAATTTPRVQIHGLDCGSGNVEFMTAPRAFLYSGGTMSDLGSLGGISSEAAAINSTGMWLVRRRPPSRTGNMPSFMRAA